MMNQGDLINKIGNILRELQEQQQYVAENPQHLNGLELELFLSNANFLTDHIHILMKTVGQHEVKEIAAPTVSTTDNEPATFEFVLKEEASANKFDFEEKKVEEIFNRPLSEEEQAIIARKQKQNETPQAKPSSVDDEDSGSEPFLVNAPEEVEKEEPAQVIQTRVIEEARVVEPAEPLVIPVKPVEQTIAEKPNKQTLNEMLASSLSGGAKTEEPKSEISDLRQAISLNDKLLYVKDLFHGYSLAYAEVIDLLNKMPDYESADAFLQKNYAVQNNWGTKQATVDRFYELLSRRFPVK